MATVLYVASSGRAIKVSPNNQPFHENPGLDFRFVRVLKDAKIPDGYETTPFDAEGNAIEGYHLGHAKQVVESENLCRNATAEEISGWAGIEAADENAMDKEDAVNQIWTWPISRKVNKAYVKMFLRFHNDVREGLGLPIVTYDEAMDELFNDISEHD